MKSGKLPYFRYIMVLLVLSSVVVFVIGASTANSMNVPVFIDDFEDGVKSSIWSKGSVGDGVTIVEKNQRLEIEFDSDAHDDPRQHVFGSWYESTCKLRGDFDVRVDYTLLDWPYANGVRVGLGVNIIEGNHYTGVERVSFGSTRDFGGRPREVYLTHLPDGVQGFIETTHNDGALRLKRTGPTIVGYYLENDQWKPIHTASFGTEDMRFNLSSWSHDYAFMDQDVSFAFDNFMVSDGEMICPLFLPLFQK